MIILYIIILLIFFQLPSGLKVFFFFFLPQANGKEELLHFLLFQLLHSCFTVFAGLKHKWRINNLLPLVMDMNQPCRVHASENINGRQIQQDSY